MGEDIYNAVEMSVSAAKERKVPTEPFYEQIHIEIVNTGEYRIDCTRMGDISVDVPDSIEFKISPTRLDKDGKRRIVEHIQPKSSINLKLNLYQLADKQTELNDEVQIQLKKSNKMICMECFNVTA